MTDCVQCKGKGQVPFIKADGMASRYAWVRCECHTPDHEYLPPVKAEDFDFACSQDWRDFYEWSINGRGLVDPEPPDYISSPRPARPIVNVTYQIQSQGGQIEKIPAIKAIFEEIQIIKGRLYQRSIKRRETDPF